MLIKGYHYLKSSETFLEFKKAHITDAVKEAHSLIKVCKNLFDEIKILLLLIMT